MTTNNSSLQEKTAVCFDFYVAKHFANQNQLLENQTTIIENQKLLWENQTVMMQQIESFKNVQNSLIQKVANFAVQLENAVTQMGTLDKGRVSLLSEQTSPLIIHPFMLNQLKTYKNWMT